MTPPRPPIETRLAAAGLAPIPRLAWAEVDLDALRANHEVLREAAGPGVRVEPVVKADAYGHGAVEVTRVLAAAGAPGCSVATIDEAYELRAAGIELPILVLYPVPPQHVADAARARIAIAVGGGRLLDRTLEAARYAATAGAPELELHLEVETGLGRGGVLPEEVLVSAARVLGTPGVRLGGVWSHLAAAEDPASTRMQGARFAAAVRSLDLLVEIGDAPGAVRRHLAGSAGLFGREIELGELVRPGLATYGLLPDGFVPPPATAALAARLWPVLSLHARAVRVVELPADHGVSYGPTFTTSGTTRIATLPIGYADGWRRTLTDRASALVRGMRVPIVGRVTMDGIMVDVTAVPGLPVDLDDEFVLVGTQGSERISAAEVAAACGTVSHELFAGLMRRLPRVQVAGGSPIGIRVLADPGAAVPRAAAPALDPDPPAAPAPAADTAADPAAPASARPGSAGPGGRSAGRSGSPHAGAPGSSRTSTGASRPAGSAGRRRRGA